MARTIKIIRIAIAALAIGLGHPAHAAADVAAVTQPNWSQLTPEQRIVLKPLADDWSAMGEFRRKKWLGIAQRYSAMSADEKSRVDQRMKDWANLSPEQRRQARANYKSLKQVAPDQKEDIKRKWDEYTQLPAEERAQLKADAVRKPVIKPTEPAPLTPPLKQKIAPTSPLLPPTPVPAPGVVKGPNSGVLPAPTKPPTPVADPVLQTAPGKP